MSVGAGVATELAAVEAAGSVGAGTGSSVVVAGAVDRGAGGVNAGAGGVRFGAEPGVVSSSSSSSLLSELVYPVLIGGTGVPVGGRLPLGPPPGSGWRW